MGKTQKTSGNPESTIDPHRFSADVRDLLRLLADHRVRYVIVGGQAVIFYGSVRLTGDVDFFYERTEQNAQRLFAALSTFWNGDAPGLRDADELAERGLILQYGVPPNRIDLINELEGVSFDECWSGKKTASMST
jgi:hypothetical protein